MKTFHELRATWRPCAAAVEWALRQPTQDLAVLWTTCPRGDWLVWGLEQLNQDCVPIMLRCIDFLRGEVAAKLEATYMYADKKKIKQMMECPSATDAAGLLVVRDTARYALAETPSGSVEGRALAALMMAADEGWRVCTFGGPASTVLTWASAGGVYAAQLADQVREMTPGAVVEAALDVAKEHV